MPEVTERTGREGMGHIEPKEEAGKGKDIYSNATLDTQVEVFAEGAMNFLDPQSEFIANATHPQTGGGTEASVMNGTSNASGKTPRRSA
jgi:hypothetical protein